MRFPSTRLRRLRQFGWSRDLVREYQVSANDLVWPLIISAENETVSPVLPGMQRRSTQASVDAARRARELGIPMLAVFPHIDPHAKDEEGSEALNPDGLVPRTIRAISEAVPDIGIMADIALDPFTAHGHDGVIRDGAIDNDATIELLVRQALICADAGANVVAPSDMMDGRVSAIRAGLDAAGYDHVMILSYAAKYASAFYGPYRDAIGSASVLMGDKRTYQMDPGNRSEALREVQMDIEEGADMVMVKPGLAYLDIIRDVRDAFGVPTLAYQTSGEYAMLRTAAQAGFLEERRAVMETLLSYKRAGCAGIVTYFAEDVAGWLRE